MDDPVVRRWAEARAGVADAKAVFDAACNDSELIQQQIDTAFAEIEANKIASNVSGDLNRSRALYEDLKCIGILERKELANAAMRLAYIRLRKAQAALHAVERTVFDLPDRQDGDSLH